MKKLAVALTLVLVAGCSKKGTESSTASGSDAAAAAATTAAGPSLAQKALSFVTGTSPFEGDITMQVTTSGKPPQTIAYEVKGTKMRFDAPAGSPGGASYVIFDSTDKKMITVTDAQKMAMVMDMNTAGMPGGAGMHGPAGMHAATAAPTTPPKIDKTGKTDTVAGYECEIWNVTASDGAKSDVCVAKGISWLSGGNDPAVSWMSELTGQGMFPLRAINHDPSGKETSRMEVTKVDKKSVDASRFEVPAGYKTVNMSDMMKGMGMGMGMGRPPTH